MAKKKSRRKKAKLRKPARKQKRPAAKRPTKTKTRRKGPVERELEEGLRETFPASDPLAQTDPTRSIKE
jgi:hypothetical protein